MYTAALFDVPAAELAQFCRRHQVRELALFGSVVREEQRADSDVDLLVSFAPAVRVTFSTMARMQREIEVLVGRKVDLVPKEGLNPAIREHVLASGTTALCGVSSFTCWTFSRRAT